MIRSERHQVWIYLAAAVIGLGLGTVAPGMRGPADMAIWPALALLLYVTFTQIELARLREAADDRRFVAAVLTGNFVAIPLIVWALLPLVGEDPALQIGVLLVLLMPCTDWFLTFTHLAGGDTRRAIVITPVLLIAQALLLPVYLWVFVGHRMVGFAMNGRLLTAFLILIVIPLFAAWLTQRLDAQRLDERTGQRSPRFTSRLRALPVPLLALVVFLVATAQVGVASEAPEVVPRLIVIYAAYLTAAALVGIGLAWIFRLAAPPATTLVFSLGTRNSFVVLPIALALPAGWEIAVVAVVLQSLVELLGMIIYVRAVPRLVQVSGRNRSSRTGR